MSASTIAAVASASRSPSTAACSIFSLGGRDTDVAHRRIHSLANAAISRIAPRKRKYRLLSHPARGIPRCGHAEDETAEGGADDRAEPAGQEASPEHGGDDVEELLADALEHVRPVGLEQHDLTVDPTAHGDRDEQTDLRRRRRHADHACRLLVATDGEDPVADLRARQHPRADHRHHDEPQDGHLEPDGADVDEVGGEQLPTEPSIRQSSRCPTTWVCQ